MLHDSAPNLKVEESPKPTPNITPMRAALIQRMLVIISCRAIIKAARKKTISGTTTRIATDGAGPGIMECPNLGTIKNRFMPTMPPKVNTSPKITLGKNTAKLFPRQICLRLNGVHSKDSMERFIFSIVRV